MVVLRKVQEPLGKEGPAGALVSMLRPILIVNAYVNHSERNQTLCRLQRNFGQCFHTKASRNLQAKYQRLLLETQQQKILHNSVVRFVL